MSSPFEATKGHASTVLGDDESFAIISAWNDAGELVRIKLPLIAAENICRCVLAGIQSAAAARELTELLLSKEGGAVPRVKL